MHSTSQTTNIIFVLNVGVKGDVQVVPIKRLYEKIVHGKQGVSTDLFNNSKVKIFNVLNLVACGHAKQAKFQVISRNIKKTVMHLFIHNENRYLKRETSTFYCLIAVLEKLYE